MDTVTRFTDYPPSLWRVGGLPMAPYLFEHVEVTGEGDPSGEPGELMALKYDVLPYLLEVEPGDGPSFVSFVARFGLMEFIHWVAEWGRRPTAWDRIAVGYELGGFRRFPEEMLRKAWTENVTRDLAWEEYTTLRSVLSWLENEPGGTVAAGAIDYVLGHAEDRGRLGWHYRVLESDGRPVLVAQPTHIYSRAWLEVVHRLSDTGLLARTCQHCGRPFMPTRRNVSYCPGTDHQQRAAASRRHRNKSGLDLAIDRVRKRLSRAKSEEERIAAEAELDRLREEKE